MPKTNEQIIETARRKLGYAHYSGNDLAESIFTALSDWDDQDRSKWTLDTLAVLDALMAPERMPALEQNPNSAADVVNHPQHYTAHPSGVECITVAEHFGFCLGNVIKYVWRADEKGSPIEDLEKAAVYLDREIQRRKRDAA